MSKLTRHCRRSCQCESSLIIGNAVLRRFRSPSWLKRHSPYRNYTGLKRSRPLVDTEEKAGETVAEKVRFMVS